MFSIRQAVRGSDVRFLTILFIFMSTVAHAQDMKTFRSWSVGPTKDRDGVFAATVNDSGGVLGQYCFWDSKTCYWLIATDVNCEESDRYPVLLNAPSGASNQNIRCLKVDGKARYVFENFDSAARAMKGNGRIGVAFPMASGQFQVARFSLEGVDEAVAFMRTVAEAMVNKVEQKSTRDTRL